LLKAAYAMPSGLTLVAGFGGESEIFRQLPGFDWVKNAPALFTRLRVRLWIVVNPGIGWFLNTIRKPQNRQRKTFNNHL